MSPTADINSGTTDMSLRWRIALTFIVLQIASLTLVVWLCLDTAMDNRRQQFQHNQETVLSLLNGLSVHAFLIEDYSDLYPYFEQLRRNPEIIEILLSSEGRVVAGTQAELSGQPLPPLISDPAGPWLTRVLTGPGGLERGRIHVHFSSAPMREAYRQALRFSLILGGVGLLLVAVAGNATGYLLTRRLQQLTGAARNISAGDYRIDLPLRGTDELARLAAAFLEMSRELERRMSELQASEERFVLAVDGSNDAIFDWDLPNNRLFVSERLSEILDLPTDYRIRLPQDWKALIHPEDLQAVDCATDRHLRSHEPFHLEFRMLGANGAEHWILARGQAVWDHHDNATRMVGSLSEISARKTAEAERRKLQEQLQLILDTIGEGVIGMDVQCRAGFVNPAAMRLLGYRPEDILGRPTHETFHRFRPDGSSFPQADCPSCKALEVGEAYAGSSTIYWRADGTPLPVDVVVEPMWKDGVLQGSVIAFADITKRKQVEAALIAEKERAQTTLQTIADAVLTTDNQGRVDYANPAAERITGKCAAQLGDSGIEAFLGRFSAASCAPVIALAREVLARRQEQRIEKPTVLQRDDDQRFHVRIACSPLTDQVGRIAGTVMSIQDVSQLEEMADRLRYQASHDALTGLINRRELEARLDRALRAVRRDPGRLYALCYIDLDQFKVVNDSYGHNAGDELLRQLPQSLLTLLDKNRHTLARLGGDEFGVLLQDASIDEASDLAVSLLEAIREFHFAWGKDIFRIGASIGVVAISNRYSTLVEVLGAADQACYMAKDQGRNRIHVYRVEDRELQRHRQDIQWFSRIKEALDQLRFVLHYQPIRAIRDKSRHYEVLLRMASAEQDQLTPPGAFLPSAERFGLMVQIDRWVVAQAIAEFAAGMQKHPDTVLAVNVSGLTLRDQDFPLFVQNLFKQHQVPADRFCFEITETSAIASFAEALTFIHHIRGLGCRFALDDFGSGFSSFSYLKQLPLDYLKIDGSFVRGMLNSSTDNAMVEAINSIGHVLGLKTIAEFVENEAIYDSLKHIGVDYVQGYWIGKPDREQRGFE